MRDFKHLLFAISPMLAVGLIVTLLGRCDPDKPIDVGVTVAPCPEAAAPYIVPTPPPYIPTEAGLALAEMIANFGEMSKAEEERWWAHYHELSDASRLEREARDK